MYSLTGPRKALNLKSHILLDLPALPSYRPSTKASELIRRSFPKKVCLLGGLCYAPHNICSPTNGNYHLSSLFPAGVSRWRNQTQELKSAVPLDSQHQRSLHMATPQE